MSNIFIFFLGVSFFISSNAQVWQDDDTDYIYDKIYTSIDSYPCVLLLDKDGEMGCSTGRDGVVGNLKYLKNSSEFNKFCSSPSKDDKMIMIPSFLFTKENYDQLIDTDSVSGIVVLTSTSPEQGFSPASGFPNKQFGLYPDSEYVWNTQGNGWLFEKNSVPMIAVDIETAQTLIEKAEENDKEDRYPFWAIDIKLFMWAAHDATTCLRRDFCEPLGGHTIWWTTGSSTTTTSSTSNKKDQVLILSRMDSMSFFQDLAIGSESDMSSLAGILGMVDSLGTNIQPNTNQSQTYLKNKQYVWLVFNGESWGYIGSRKFLSDLTQSSSSSSRTPSPSKSKSKSKSSSFVNKKKRNLYRRDSDSDEDYSNSVVDLSRVKYIIELGQLGIPTVLETGEKQNNIYLHHERPVGPENQRLIDAFMSASKYDDFIEVKEATDTGSGIPPSSSMSFLLKQSNLSVVVLNDFDMSYNTQFYHSEFDTFSQVNSSLICSAASLALRTLYLIDNDESTDFNSIHVPDSLQVNCSLVEELMYCLTKNISCPLVSNLVPSAEYATSPPSHYVSVYRSGGLSLTEAFIYDWVYNNTLTEDPFHCSNTAQCPDGLFCLSSTCQSTAIYISEAYSPGLKYDDGIWSISDDSQPTYTESYWDSIEVRLFQRDNPIIEILVLVVGLLEFSFCITTVYYLKKNYTFQRFED